MHKSYHRSPQWLWRCKGDIDYYLLTEILQKLLCRVPTNIPDKFLCVICGFERSSRKPPKGCGILRHLFRADHHRMGGIAGVHSVGFHRWHHMRPPHSLIMTLSNTTRRLNIYIDHASLAYSKRKSATQCQLCNVFSFGSVCISER